ncbi:MAG: hypothetical protein SCALA702_32770 [Melioribacteraceae bacterium]|nr:MAG: hypothetical protein SCALA702_32770 [Melioribacteraceae bacterium]
MKKLQFYWDRFDQILKKSKLPSFLKYRSVWSLIVILLVIVLVSTATTANVDASSIPTYTVKQDKFVSSITESGEIRAKNSQAITAPRIRNLKIIYLIPEGTYVSVGDTVAQFDPGEAINNLTNAESELEIELSGKAKLIANQKSSVAQMESQLSSAELSFELSKLNLEQMKFEAEAKQMEAKLQHEKNRLSFEQVKKEFESKKIIHQSERNEMDIGIRQKQSDLEKAQRELDMMTLTARAEGLIVYAVNWSNQGRKFAVGDSPWRGQVIIHLPDLSAMESVTQVNEVDVSKVQVGQDVMVKLDAFQDSAFTGTVGNVASLGKNKDGDSQIKVFEISVDINERSDILKPGMTTSNKIIMNEIADVLFVPIESVFERDGEKVVFVKNGSSFEQKKVELGEKGEDYIIVNSGVQSGDEVALLDPYDQPEEEDGGSKKNNVTLPE